MACVCEGPHECKASPHRLRSGLEFTAAKNIGHPGGVGGVGGFPLDGQSESCAQRLTDPASRAFVLKPPAPYVRMANSQGTVPPPCLPCSQTHPTCARCPGICSSSLGATYSENRPTSPAEKMDGEWAGKSYPSR
eukprot:scaffold7422_cov134-Isochrysis_galbana.AAC.7